MGLNGFSFANLSIVDNLIWQAQNTDLIKSLYNYFILFSFFILKNRKGKKISRNDREFTIFLKTIL